MVNVTVGPYEDNIALSTPVSDYLINISIISINTAIFGLCLTIVYCISLLLVMTTTRLFSMSTQMQARLNIVAPVVLTTPFWVGVLICSADIPSGHWLSLIRLPFFEAIFFSIVAWSMSTSAFIIIATLVGLVRAPDGEASAENTSSHTIKQAEEGLELDINQALVATSPPPTPRTPGSPFGPTPWSRPRMGGVTRCWHDADAVSDNTDIVARWQSYLESIFA